MGARREAAYKHCSASLRVKKSAIFVSASLTYCKSIKISSPQEDMPAKECSFGLSTLAEKETTQLQFKDVDNLVQEIKENLKLSQYDPGVYSNSSQGSRGSRNSPYVVPDRLKAANKCECEGQPGEGGRKGSWAARKRYPSMSANGKQKLEKLDDPLEMLHELISEGNLLKEAVRRLQVGLTPKI